MTLNTNLTNLDKRLHSIIWSSNPQRYSIFAIPTVSLSAT